MPNQTRAKRKEKVGFVIKDKMQKTIVVNVERRVPHPLYSKVIKRRARFYAHDELGKAQIGDKVRIVECRPLSKSKRWRLVEILKK